MRAGVKTLLAAVLASVMLSGCGLFSTRNPEAPDTGRRSWETPRLPLDVLTNMSNALFERDAVNYLRSFPLDNFTFEADNIALSNDPSLANWDYVREAGHINSLVSAGTLPADSLLFVIFTNPQETVLQDSAEILTPYELTAGVAISGAPHRMAGTAHFYLVLGAEGYWQIYRWADQRTGQQSTWSDLRSFVR